MALAFARRRDHPAGRRPRGRRRPRRSAPPCSTSAPRCCGRRASALARAAPRRGRRPPRAAADRGRRRPGHRRSPAARGACCAARATGTCDGHAAPARPRHGLALDPGAQVVVRAASTSIDGRASTPSPDDGRRARRWFFDLAAGGLRLVDADAGAPRVRARVDGARRAGCAAAGVASPCLVPRLAVLAHERLETRAELAADPARRRSRSRASSCRRLRSVADCPRRRSPRRGVALTGAPCAWRRSPILRRRARTAIGRVRAAARDALRATRGDPTLEPVRAQVTAMLARAAELDRGAPCRGASPASTARPRAPARGPPAPRLPKPPRPSRGSPRSGPRPSASRAITSSSLARPRAHRERAARRHAARPRAPRHARPRRAHDPVDAAALELRLREEALGRGRRGRATRLVTVLRRAP